MATLTGNTIASTYTELLRLGNATLSGSAGTSHYIKDSADTNSPLSLNTTQVGIGTASPDASLHIQQVATGQAMQIECVNGTTATVGPGLILERSYNGNGVDNGKLGYIQFNGPDDGSPTIQEWASIRANINDASSGTEDGTLDFYNTINATETLVMSLDAGKVGIGTATPETFMHINASTVGQSGFDKGDTSLWSMYIQADTDTGDSAGIAFGTSSAYNVGAGILYTDTGTQGKGELSFWTKNSVSADAAPVQRMILDDAGNVGIGTTSPQQLVEVAKSAAASIQRLSTWSTTDGDHSQIHFTKSASATIGTGSATAANEDLGAIVAYGCNTSSALDGAAKILFEGDAAPDSDAVPGRISFWTSDASTNQQRMIIDDAGNVGIGTTSPSKRFHIAKSSGACSLRIESAGANDGTIEFYETTNLQWKLWNDGSLADDDARLYVTDRDNNNGVYIVEDATSWTSNSDERMKDNLVELTNATTNLNTLRCVNYNSKYGSDKTKSKKRIGLIAQDIYKVYPEATTGSPDDVYEYDADAEGYKHKNAMGVAYTDLIPVLVKAIQELSAKITALENA